MFLAQALRGKSVVGIRREFQVDRGAVALGADPLALATALRKMEAVLERDAPELAESLNLRKGAWYLRAFKQAEAICRTHSQTQIRCKKLARMAVKQGRCAEDVTQALYGDVDISALPFKSALISGMDTQQSQRSGKATLDGQKGKALSA